MKIAFFSTRIFERPYFEWGNHANHEIIYLEDSLSLSTVRLAASCEAVMVFPNDDCSSTVLGKLHEMGVKYIATRSKGFDHIDIPEAYQLGIKVGCVPKYSPYSVAEHTVALLLCINRKITHAYQRNVNWDFRLEGLMGFDVHHKTVGIVGVGKIGSVVAKIFHGFGCKLIAYDPVRYDFLKDAYNLEYLDTMDELYNRSDIITLHAPLNDQTRFLINDLSIAKMKSGVVLLNTARGAIVKTTDLMTALESGKISAYGADVYENEKNYFFYDKTKEKALDGILEKLLAFDNVVLTSHQGSLTVKAMEDIADVCMHNIDCWSRGQLSGNEILPQ
jgi:D-lactate dehydrogenase